MPEPAKCRSCAARIVFAKNRQSQASLCLDAEPHPEGNVVLHADGTCTVLSKATLFDTIEDGVRHSSHFGTCPDAKRYRRSRT